MTGTDMQILSASRQPIVRMVKGEVRADSRDVAAYFKKAHGDVLRAIDVILGNRPDLRERDFALCSYASDLAEGGRSYCCFTMNFFAFNVLVMGFTGPDALDYKIRYAREYEAMQAELQRRQAPIDLNDPVVLRTLLLSHTEKVIELQGQIEAQAPKVQAYARIAESDGSMCITDAAKNLQIRPKDLFAFLRLHGWIYTRAGTTEPLAYQNRIVSGFLEHKVTIIPRDDGTERTRTQVRVTAKGLARLAEEFALA